MNLKTFARGCNGSRFTQHILGLQSVIPLKFYRLFNIFQCVDKFVGFNEQTLKTLLSLSQRFPETPHLNGFPRSITMGSEQLTAIRIVCKLCLLLDFFLNKTAILSINLQKFVGKPGEFVDGTVISLGFILFHDIL